MTFQELVSRVGKVEREGGRGLEVVMVVVVGGGRGAAHSVCSYCGLVGMLTGVMTRSAGTDVNQFLTVCCLESGRKV